MLPYDDALARVLASARPLPAEPVPSGAAQGRVVAAPVHAPADLPPFDNSAVDGFAVVCADLARAAPQSPVVLPVVATVAAGVAPARRVGRGEAVRILTGAALPDGADGIVMVEDTAPAEGDRVAFYAPAAPDFIRRRGSDMATGELALPAQTVLGAGELGLLAALNQSHITCHRLPRVGLITTGDEVVPVGDTPLAPGQIRNSNAAALHAAITEAGGVVAAQTHAADTPDAVREALAACAGCDVVITCGGVSVGEYDYVKAVVGELGTLDFWRIAVRPGKPLAFGAVGGALFFGLPGNPVSSLVTFELFVRPVLRRLRGHAALTRPVALARLTCALPHAPGRREFVRAQVTPAPHGYDATPTGPQGSHRLHSLVGANAYLVAHETHGDYAAGATLPALLLREP